MSEIDETGTDSVNEDHRILVIGKSGNGKSAVCNTLTACQFFKTGKGLSATTRSQQLLDVNRLGHNIRVIDTPDVTNCNMTSSEMKEEVCRWRHITDPYPTIVLLAVRCDVRFTQEEYVIYRQIKKLWGNNSMTDRLVVIFTFADRQDEPIEQELPSVCPQLKAVLEDASQRYLLCDNKASKTDRDGVLPQLLNLMKTTPVSRQRQQYLWGNLWGNLSSVTGAFCTLVFQCCVAMVLFLALFIYQQVVPDRGVVIPTKGQQ